MIGPIRTALPADDVFQRACEISRLGARLVGLRRRGIEDPGVTRRFQQLAAGAASVPSAARRRLSWARKLAGCTAAEGQPVEVAWCGTFDQGAIDTEKARLLLTSVSPRQTLSIRLTSRGGNIQIAEQVAAMLLRHQGPIQILVPAFADSAAVTVLCAGDRRVCSRAATFMLHNAAIPNSERLTAARLQAMAAELQNQDRRYVETIAMACCATVVRIRRLVDSNTTLTARAALDLGLVHAIVKWPP